MAHDLVNLFMCAYLPLIVANSSSFESTQGLHRRPAADLSPQAKQRRLRVWMCCTIADRWYACSYGQPRLIDLEDAWDYLEERPHADPYLLELFSLSELLGRASTYRFVCLDFVSFYSISFLGKADIVVRIQHELWTVLAFLNRQLMPFSTPSCTTPTSGSLSFQKTCSFVEELLRRKEDFCTSCSSAWRYALDRLSHARAQA